VLSGFAAVAANAAVPAATRAQSEQPVNTGRIDIHRHFVPPGYVVDKARTWLNDRSTAGRQVEEMDQAGVALSVISISAPGIHHQELTDLRGFSRLSNDFMARLRADYPGRFGLFAYLPIPDIDATLREIEYALDTLKADGVHMLTNYGDKFLGEEMFAPIFEELNRRGAVLYTHPTGHPCCENLVPGLRDADIEYGTNTTRAIAKFVFSGHSRRYPKMRVIWSHAGGTMPFLIRRFEKRVRDSKEFQPVLPQGFLPEVQKFYYDIAQAPERAPMAALRAVVPVSQIMFGTDYPHLTTVEHITGLAECGVFNAAELSAIGRDNALRLLPTLRPA
jgi:predicted TIM-barrel fold metal-dependent hydrolase